VVTHGIHGLVVRERDGVETVTVYSGKLDGDTIRGETEFEFGNEVRKREWIATREDVARALDAGAVAAVAGTRFLLSEESRAHPEYRARLLTAKRTLLTELFGASWPARHRVIANAATEHWLGDDPRGPRLNRALNKLLAPGARYVPASLQGRMARAQTPGSRLLTPLGPTDDGPTNLLDAGALYAGETVARIDAVRPAGELVRALTP